MGAHSFTISRQKDGRFCAHIVGGYITTISDCETEQAAINNAQYAIAKNKEYASEQTVDDA
jgi:hypothetical protein